MRIRNLSKSGAIGLGALAVSVVGAGVAAIPALALSNTCDGLSPTPGVTSTYDEATNRTIWEGTVGNDVIVGTDGADVILGRGGADVLCGNGGDDVLRGNAGRDRVFGGSGDDQLHGGRGNDVVEGGEGDDTIRGGARRDVVRGDGGNDVIRGGHGWDSLDGGDGDDDVHGGTGNDNIVGGPGIDIISGGRGNDSCAADSGESASCENIRWSGPVVAPTTTTTTTIGLPPIDDPVPSTTTPVAPIETTTTTTAPDPIEDPIPSTTAPAPIPTTTTTTTTTTPAPIPTPSLSGELFVDPYNSAALWADANPNDPRSALIGSAIGDESIARWFGEWSGDIERAVSNYVNQAGNDIPVLVAYNVPDRDCGQHSAGGAANYDAYEAWIAGMARGLGDGPAIIILEPDSIALNGCAGSERNDAIGNAAATINTACDQCQVYIDAGHSNWIDANEMAERLLDAGVLGADGFFTNVSNYNATANEEVFGAQVLDALGNPSGIGQVIDVSRNGNGSNGEWCDPGGRAIGVSPTLNTGNSNVDALLWVKVPGEADGCAAGAGQFVPQNAFDLARN